MSRRPPPDGAKKLLLASTAQGRTSIRSSDDLRSSRLDRNHAKKLIGTILRNGSVLVWEHCREELEKDDLNIVDATNVLRAGRIIEEPEQAKGAYRYRVHTERICVVVEILSSTCMSVVTAWRKK